MSEATIHELECELHALALERRAWRREGHENRADWEANARRITDIGREIYDRFGATGMSESFDRVALTAPINSDEMHDIESALDAHWGGIGEWAS